MKWVFGSLMGTAILFGGAATILETGSGLTDSAVAESRINQPQKSDLLTRLKQNTATQMQQYLNSVGKGDLMQLTDGQPPEQDAPAPGEQPAQIIAQDQTTDPAAQTDDLLADDTADAPSDSLVTDDSADVQDDLLADDADDAANDDLLADDSDDAANDDLLADDSDDAATDDLLADDSDDAATDDLLADDDDDADPLDEEDSQTAEAETDDEDETGGRSAAEEHARLFVESKYPSAYTCASCHPKHYEEWAISSHSYAQLSPVYMAMQVTINMKTSGTTGDFCIRCHNQVGMNLGESIYMSNLDRSPTSREGITCVVCHRVNQDYGKVSGRMALTQGDLFSAIYGPTGNAEVSRVIASPDYPVNTVPGGRGQDIHRVVEPFFALSKPNFCGACHDVTLPNGFRLEEAFAEWQQSPAAKRGETCQDCHMSRIQGKISGYQWGPAAVVDDVPTKNRKLTNHVMSGPDYSIIHPGLYPHNVKATDLATPRQWLQFRYQAGWGTDAFEDNVPAGYRFPKHWDNIDIRYDARKILEKQFELLAKAKALRLQVLRNGFTLSDINVTKADRGGLDFDIDVSNATDGHGVPTGFDAERLIFLQVTVTDPKGKVVFKSGDRDPNGDVRDLHSRYVHNGELPLDEYLFNLQSKFIVRQVRGGEREQILAVNTSAAALPFVRPDRRAAIIYGRPRGARKHKKTIEPLGSRNAAYSVDADELTVDGVYSIKIKLIAQMVPVNLIGAIMQAGFDYGMSPKGIADRVVAGAAHVWSKTTKVRINGAQ